MPSQPRNQSAVYTVLFGPYERLNDAQNVGDSAVPFVCFTDDPTLTSTVWDVRVVKPRYPTDLQRSQRDVKIRGTTELAEFERTLYIDNSVSLKVDPGAILDDWLAEHDLAIPSHSFRTSVLDEFLAVIDHGRDDSARVYEQLEDYSATARQVLAERPTWNGMIARRNTPEVQSTMNRWFEEVLRHSRRDQLSANFIFDQSSVVVRRVELDNSESWAHRWPVELGRAITPSHVEPSDSMPELARIRRLEQERAAARAALADLSRTVAEERRVAAEQDAEFRATRSYRAAARLSRIAGWLKLARPHDRDGHSR